MEQNKEEFQKVWTKIVAKAWSDAAFKKQLLENPTEVLKSYNLKIPSGKKIAIHENTEEIFNLVLPKQPEEALSEEKLKEIAAGIELTSNGCSTCFHTR